MSEFIKFFKRLGLEEKAVCFLQGDGVFTDISLVITADDLLTLSQSLEPNMKFMIFVKSNPCLEAMSDSAFKKSMAQMNVFNEELKKAGVMKDCDGLRPSREGKRVRFDGESRSVVDGPFEGDLVAGYWLWELPSIEDAVAWVKRCPNPMPTPSEIGIRPI